MISIISKVCVAVILLILVSFAYSAFVIYKASCNFSQHVKKINYLAKHIKTNGA